MQSRDNDNVCFSTPPKTPPILLSELMEFPNLGVHCAVSSCSKLDFLPFECDCCHKIFCREHRVYSDHNCTESYTKDVRIPVCPLCNQPIPVKNGEDPNICVNQHIMRDCEEQKNKLYNNKCSFAGCKKKELVRMTCTSCHKNYCIKHRLEADHQCIRGQNARGQSARGQSITLPSSKLTSNPKPSTRSTSSGARKPQSSLMSQIGADLNKERQGRTRGQQQTGTKPLNSNTSQSGLTEDEALSIAIAASLKDSSQPSHPTNKETTPINKQQEHLEEDEALARALAASLDDQSKSPSNKKSNSVNKSSDDSTCILS